MTTTDRRNFLRLSALAGGALGVGAFDLAGQPMAAPVVSSADSPLKILVLGGTGFIGPHEIRYALARGHEVTMFNRGRSNPELFPNVERLIGDRDAQLEALEGRQWDAVIDNSGFYPRHARLSAELLEPNVAQYLFVSSISAYDGETLQPRQHPDEAPYATMADPTDESEGPYGPSYGPRKALAEQEVLKVFGSERTTLVRPGLITGPGDPTDRIRHWFARAEMGGEILVPGPVDGPVQYIDARDLSGWMIRLLEDGTPGNFNGVGPRDDMTTAELVYGLAAAVSSSRTFTWVDWDFLVENEFMAGYTPIVPPGAEPFMTIYNQNSVDSGLTYRSWAETTRDMYAEYLTIANGGYTEGFGWRAGLSPEDSARALAAWHEQM
jgi:2'-hydroxyisoflavone reductase